MPYIADNREDGGKLVRAAWIAWAKRQADPKPSWLVEWNELAEIDKEADRCIWDEIVGPYATIIADFQRITAQLRSENNKLQDALLDKELADFVRIPRKADDEMHRNEV